MERRIRMVSSVVALLWLLIPLADDGATLAQANAQTCRISRDSVVSISAGGVRCLRFAAHHSACRALFHAHRCRMPIEDRLARAQSTIADQFRSSECARQSRLSYWEFALPIHAARSALRYDNSRVEAAALRCAQPYLAAIAHQQQDVSVELLRGGRNDGLQSGAIKFFASSGPIDHTI